MSHRVVFLLHAPDCIDGEDSKESEDSEEIEDSHQSSRKHELLKQRKRLSRILRRFTLKGGILKKTVALPS